MAPNHSTVSTNDGIEWHVVRQGTGPDLVLVPSGEGDWESYAKIAAVLANSFTVTTFDMPGMSHSKAPEAAMTAVTAEMLAGQIIGLMDKLEIRVATFYGCSSGALAVLTIVKFYPDRVQSGIVHEAPLRVTGEAAAGMSALRNMDDEGIQRVCRGMFGDAMIEDKAAWEALGPKYHARLDKNYVTWVHSYIGTIEDCDFTKEDLTKKPVDWTVGGLTAAGLFFNNVTMATAFGIPISVLPCKHFPQVTIPDKLAEHIRTSAMKHV